MDAELKELLRLVEDLDRAVGPDTEFRWYRRGADAHWFNDDGANDAFLRLREAWRAYRANHRTVRFE